jgi:hypothetical protein
MASEAPALLKVADLPAAGAGASEGKEEEAPPPPPVLAAAAEGKEEEAPPAPEVAEAKLPDEERPSNSDSKVEEAPRVAAAPSGAATDYRTLYASMKAPELFSAWNTERDPRARGQILTTLAQRSLTEGAEATYPSAPVATREREAGLYPDPDDPQFGARLYEKREFYEARAIAAGVAEGDIDPCSDPAAEKLFELTPVQRIVSRFLHPLTPYYGMLLFHGVGVGKTCSAVTIAEQFLDAAPSKKVIVLVPQALQDNFKKTVFDPAKLQWDAAAGRWKAKQCTGVAYLERLGLLTNPDEREVLYRVEEDRRSRYTVTGYQAFANWIERTLKASVPAGLTDLAARTAAENEVLRRLFSDHLVIVDEAHNLRDTGADAAAAAAEEEVAGATEGGAAAGEAAENAGGKALNPYLRRIVLNAEGLRLVLMTATPMYNSAPEIVLLLNYLIMNDAKSEKRNLRMDLLFDKLGNLRDERAAKLLARAARAYVSYMRGENPYTFPLRMRPAAAAASPVDEWPAISATRKPVVIEEIAPALNALPIVFTEPVAGSPVDLVLRSSTTRTGAAAGAEGEEAPEAPVRDTMLDLRMQMANISYPNQMYGGAGWENYFNAVRVEFDKRKIQVFTPRAQAEGPFNPDSVFTGEGLRGCAPKIARIVESVRKARGICFVYSRYIKAGALPLAVSLERAGFQRRMANGAIAPLLAGVPKVAPICALCGEAHGASAAAGGFAHPFRPATYVLLTSEDEISPSFAGLVRQAATWPADPEWGPLGGNVKVVIGSQVASEGLDLKCVREMHILDSWYHLNRIDQIIGRAIRYCSHTALRAVEEREGQPRMTYNNCLIYLHALRGGGAGTETFETADMYAYRIAVGKAQRVGVVQRLLKAHAWDCNLELEAITFAGLPKRKQIDAQGRTLADYSIDDQDYTTYCDYQKCRHECAVAVARTPAEGLRLNVSTFRTMDARRIILAKQDAVRHLFDAQIYVPETVVQELFADLPWEIASEALMELLDGRRFRLTRPDGVEGYLIKRGGYLVFQPQAITNTDIPMALRYATAFQLRRQFLEPAAPVFSRAEEVPVMRSAAAVRAATAAAAVAGGGSGAGSGAPQGAGVAAAAAKPTLLAAVPTGTEAVAPVSVVAAAPPELLARWAQWEEFVASGGEAELPSYLSGTTRIWKWILRHFRAIPAVAEVALRWWVDKYPDYAGRRGLLELALSESGGASKALVTALRPDLFRSSQMVAYRVLNPDTREIEFWCRQTGSTGGGGAAAMAGVFTPCTSTVASVVGRALGDKSVAIPGESGSLLGFLTLKTNRLVYKTLDIAKLEGAKRKTLVGAECGNVSNLGEHHPRIRILHAIGRAVAELAPLMLPDGEDDWVEAGKAARMEELRPAHMKDITHQPLCLYMEFLTRLFDHQKLGGRRWFLSAVEAAQSGLKGKK